MKKINLKSITFIGNAVIAVDIKYEDFVEKFGPKHYDHPKDWDAPGPIELWVYELPWGQRIILEYYLGTDFINIYMGILEVNSVIEYLDFKDYKVHIDHGMILRLKNKSSKFSEGLGNYILYRQDDNGNIFKVKTCESKRVAEHYKNKYESTPHKQLYYIEIEKKNI